MIVTQGTRGGDRTPNVQASRSGYSRSTDVNDF